VAHRELDEVAWSSLRHAYGAADDVPELIRGLRGGRRRASRCLDELYGSITHQGSRDSATAAAIPFLVDVAMDTRVEVRTEVLALVTFAAIGFTGEVLDWQAQRDLQAAGDERAAWDAVAAEQGSLRRLLRDPDPSVRRAALRPLVWTGDRDPEVLDTIERGLRAPTWEDQLAGWIAAVVLGWDPGPALLAAPVTGPARFGWAMAALRFAGDACPPDAVDELGAVFASVEQGQELTACELLAGDTPELLAASALATVPPALAAHTASQLLVAIGGGYLNGVEPLLAYLRLCFGAPDEGRFERGIGDADWLRLEALLPALAGWDLDRGSARQPVWELAEYGLPTSPEELRDLLGRPAPPAS
jgi:hypothetical protein